MNPVAGSIVITSDGTGGTAATPSNNWSGVTNGLVAAPTESTGGTNVNGASTFTYSPTPGTAAGSTKFTAQIGGASGTLPPGATGTLTYSLHVK